jgi:hypothetical protein
MRSRFDTQLENVASRVSDNPGWSGRQLSAREIEQLIHQYRAVVLGELIADACIWVARSLRRTLAAVGQRQAKTPARPALSGS